MNEENIPKEKVLVVGDSCSDYEASKHAGVDFIGRISKTNPFNKI